jgi:two-component system, cell cycle sensor histidine kinase and response regulator CckA
MPRTLRILVLEDMPQDAELEIAALEAAGYKCEWTRVDNRAEFLTQFEEGEYDLVLSDYSLPSFDGLSAVRLVTGSPKDIPFILISGTLGEEAAVEAMKQGVTDFVLKDRLPKLPLVVERAMQERDERRRASEAERQIHLQAAALESAANAIVITDPKGVVTFTNRAFATLTGYSEDEVLGEDLSILKSGEHDDAFYSALWRTITSGNVWQGELINRRKDGSHYFEEQTITPVKNGHGEIINFIGVKQDISQRKKAETERRQAEEALRDSEERYRALVENAIDIIYTHDLDGNFLSVNNAVEKITGYTKDQVLKMNLAQVVAPEYLDKAREMTAVKLDGRSVTAYELEILAADGHRVTVEVNTRILRKKDLPIAVQGIARDITERKALEEQLRHALKMEAVGLLAGGIAHDFNNLLTAISGYSSLTLRKMPKGDPLIRNIEEIKNASDRAASLTSQLLAFSRKQVLKPSVLDLNQVILGIDTLLRRITRENVELVLDFGPELGSVSADRGQVEHIVVNLAINACDAMPDGGRLLIKTQNVWVDGARAPGRVPGKAGAWVRLSVSDTGHGMDAATQQRIFEPFFTTKAVGKGTGLGLAMVHGTVTQSGGEILVHSMIGSGTTFEIYLPRVDKDDGAPKPATVPEERPGRSGTVLLVEDEASVRELVREFLIEFGYTVLEAPDGSEALALFRDHAGKIDLLLTDVSMPRMNGPQLRDEILKLDPEIKVLFMSGFADDILRKTDPEGKTPLIDKPFTPDALARKVRQILEG